jgi:hypothetical protein
MLVGLILFAIISYIYKSSLILEKDFKGNLYSFMELGKTLLDNFYAIFTNIIDIWELTTILKHNIPDWYNQLLLSK